MRTLILTRGTAFNDLYLYSSEILLLSPAQIEHVIQSVVDHALNNHYLHDTYEAEQLGELNKHMTMAVLLRYPDFNRALLRMLSSYASELYAMITHLQLRRTLHVGASRPFYQYKQTLNPQQYLMMEYHV